MGSLAIEDSSQMASLFLLLGVKSAFNMLVLNVLVGFILGYLLP